MTIRIGSRRATINDVARAANVSRQTVSNVVNRPDRVAPQTLRRVQAEIERLAYRPSSAAKSLREQRAGAIGLELDARGGAASAEIAYPFLAQLSVAARDHRCHVVTFGSDAPALTTHGYEAMVRAHLVDAFVLHNTHRGDPRPQWLADHDIPFATFGRVWDDPGFTAWGDVDGRLGTADAVDHLVEQGYERVGFVGWPEGSEVGDDRLRGWRDRAAERGVLAEDLLARTEQDIAGAQEAGRSLAARLRPRDALVCVSDVVGVGVQGAVIEAGLTPGRDVGITGFDGTATAQMFDLTTVVQPLAEIVEHLLTQIDVLLAGGPVPEHGALLAPTLRPAASTRRR
ncbi:LacI family DNA-binding transcriptional regulator [Arsenicicoccus sp. oral taxon 190]|uniref:LacI family DNA-binding transcriptional regulator n=1 Tax=Arsenicicoccus sp. oral taxon 190 TaxID=1658671 RepID=UPI00067B1424|nr:LacI family DNA-binding transcriptional regulator [Arsenicicoccus sp. oral taxon 190]